MLVFSQAIIGYHTTTMTDYNFYDKTSDNNGRVDHISKHDTDTTTRQKSVYDFNQPQRDLVSANGSTNGVLVLKKRSQRETSNYAGGKNSISAYSKEQYTENYSRSFTSIMPPETADPNALSTLVTTTGAGLFDVIYELDGRASYDNVGVLIWDQNATTAEVNGLDMGLSNSALTEGANGSIGNEAAWWETANEPFYTFGEQVFELSDQEFLPYHLFWNNELSPELSASPLGSGGVIGILAAPLPALSNMLDKMSAGQIDGYATNPYGTDLYTTNTLYDGFASNDPAYFSQPYPGYYGPSPPPIGSVIPPAAYEKEPPPQPPDVPPTTDPGTAETGEEHANCDCTCGPASTPIPYRIEVYEIVDGMGTLWTSEDDEVYGYLISYYYKGQVDPTIVVLDKNKNPLPAGTYLNDINGNPYDNYLNLVSVIGAGAKEAIAPERLVQSPKATNQIAEIKARMAEIRQNPQANKDFSIDSSSQAYEIKIKIPSWVPGIGGYEEEIGQYEMSTEYQALQKRLEELTTIGRAEGLWNVVPIYANARGAIVDAQEGKPIQAVFHAGMAIADVAALKSLLTGVAKLLTTSADDVARVGLSNIDNTVENVDNVNRCAYSTAFEMELNPVDFGRSRSVHFNRANAALSEKLSSDARFAAQIEDLIPGAKDAVARFGGRQTPINWTWEHAGTSTAGGREGVMRLVPTSQHTPGSPWWRILHPDHGARGGYAEWAIPNGAPRN